MRALAIIALLLSLSGCVSMGDWEATQINLCGVYISDSNMAQDREQLSSCVTYTKKDQ